MSIKVYTVEEITHLIKDILESNFYGIWVQGEISSLRFSSTGHLYFSLVDENATLGCLIYKSRLNAVKLKVENGKNVLVFGSLSLYKKAGEYRLIVEHIQETGKGKRFYNLEKLKKEFKEKGYFDRKRAIPGYPRKVILLTSPTGAAVEDIINIVSRRSFGIEIFIFPISVQGETARESILKALKMINLIDEKIDVVVLARGGGSNEDLWIFNDPDIAKALFNVKFPTISAIGHEIDFTLCDFVADKRAETPSAAAEMLTQSWIDLKNRIKTLSSYLEISLGRVIKFKQQQLERFSTRRNYLRIKSLVEGKIIYTDKLADTIVSHINKLLNYKEKKFMNYNQLLIKSNPSEKLNSLKQRVEYSKKRIESNTKHLINTKSTLLELLTSKIINSSPLNILKRGYSITLDKYGKPIKDTYSVKKEDTIRTILHKGEITSIVKQIKKGDKPPLHKKTFE